MFTVTLIGRDMQPKFTWNIKRSHGVIASFCLVTIMCFPREKKILTTENQQLAAQVTQQTALLETLRDLDLACERDMHRLIAHSHIPVLDAGSSKPMACETLARRARDLTLRLGDLDAYFVDVNWVLSNTPSVTPIAHRKITSSFGQRQDPFDNHFVWHKGLDLSGRMGTPVVASADGSVVFAGWRGGYGKIVVIDHGFGIQTHYGHLHTIDVAEGDAVRRGDQIAEIGSTGRSTAPHLHYEVRRYGLPVDPKNYLLD